MLDDVAIRRLGAADLDACVALGGDRGWSPERRKWRLLLEVGEGYGLDDGDHGLGGCLILTRYPGGLALLSMMLVARRLERRGLGTRLMRRALEAAHGDVVALWATENGRPLYEHLGFVATGETTRHEGVLTAVAPAVSRAATADDLEAIVALDAHAIGADRRAVIERLARFADALHVVERDGRIAGYGARWPNDGVAVIGPLIANDEALARGLLTDLAATAQAPLRLDLDDDRTNLRSWLGEHGVAAVSTTTRMAHGGVPRGDRSLLHAPFMQALG